MAVTGANSRRSAAGVPSAAPIVAGKWNSSDNTGFTLSNDDHDAVSTAGGSLVKSIATKNSGQWYVEFYTDEINWQNRCGLCIASTVAYENFGIYAGQNSVGFAVSGGSVYLQAADYGDLGDAIGTYSGPEVLSLAMDFDEGLLWAGLNGTWVGDPDAGTGALFDHADLIGRDFLVGAIASDFSFDLTCNIVTDPAYTLSNFTYWDDVDT